MKRAVQRILDMDTPPQGSKLSAKQWRFCRAYVDAPDSATDAAIRAGYAKSSAHAIAHRMLSDAKIQAAIAAIQADKGAASRLDADYVRSKVAKILDQVPGSDDGPPWREYVQVLILASRVTGLIQPGERTTYISSTTYSSIPTEELRRMLNPISPALPAGGGHPELPAIDADCTPAADE